MRVVVGLRVVGLRVVGLRVVGFAVMGRIVVTVGFVDVNDEVGNSVVD